LIFLLTGMLVWFLVNHLRRKEIGLAENLLELTKTRERLLSGTGLGLAIAHNIVRAHSGLLLLTSNTPETVRFTLTLPRKATSQ
jgi:two-component system NtrC family sensor kinase